MKIDPVILGVVVVLIVYTISLHELAHAWTATWAGDPTPAKHGRLTWNPLAQLDPFTSFVLPLICVLFTGYPYGFAYCPTDPSRYRRPLRDKALVGIAGPTVNVLATALFIGLLYIPQVTPVDSYNMKICVLAALFNLRLAVFNMIPLHPLDGYSVFRVFLPGGVRRSLDEFQRSQYYFGSMVAVALGSLLMPYIFPPFMNTFIRILPPHAVDWLYSIAQ